MRKVRLFDEDYHRIFSKRLNADRLYFVDLLNQLVEARRNQLRDDLNASFASVRFTLAHLTAQVVRQSELGVELISRPERWLPDQEDDIREELDMLIDYVIDEVNYYVQDRQEEDDQEEQAALFDPKVAFKSKAQIRPIERQVIGSTKSVARRDADFLFNVEPSG